VTKEIADLNGQITASETVNHQQNDLRDKRDVLLKQLSGLVDINYFETSSGAYTIMLSDGHTLVEQNEKWEIAWSDNKMHWLSTNSHGATTSTELNTDKSLGGSLGGMVEINSQLVEGNPDNYLGRFNSLVNSLIRETNQQHSQGVGTIRFSDILTSAELAEDAVLLQSTVDSKTALETIQAGTLTINDREIGRIDGATTKNGLAMTKTYNAAQAINNAYAGVNARLTTQVAGDAVSGGTLGGLDSGESVDFTVNGITVSYGPAAANESPAETAANVVAAINNEISSYNTASGPQNVPKITIRATIGTGLNGGALNSIVLYNTNAGDESSIVISGIDDTAGAAEGKLGLTDGTYAADSTHNTGQLSLFTNDAPIDIQGGNDDYFLSQLGWASSISYSDQAVASTGSAVSFVLNGKTIAPASDSIADILQAVNDESGHTGVSAIIGDGTNGGVQNSIVFKSNSADIKISGVSAAESAVLGFADITKRSVASADDVSADGKLSYDFSDHGVANSLMGLNYADQLVTDGGSFNIWLYNADGTPALPQPVNVSMERAYDLNDVADAINVSIVNAINDPSVTDPWVSASVFGNKLILTPDGSHQFAFGGDTSNFLASIGLNTFFTGNSADSIALNSAITDDMNNLAAGTINQFGEIFTGDNSNALAITNIQRKEAISFTGGTTDTLDGHYNSLVAEIGLKARSVDTDLEYNTQVNDQLKQLRDSTSGVSLDEEMANLIRFQHAYSAAAKLITASDELLTTLLNAV
jgi:flagellar hook-associated protein 1 FlgK